MPRSKRTIITRRSKTNGIVTASTTEPNCWCAVTASAATSSKTSAVACGTEGLTCTCKYRTAPSTMRCRRKPPMASRCGSSIATQPAAPAPAPIKGTMAAMTLLSSKLAARSFAYQGIDLSRIFLACSSRWAKSRPDFPKVVRSALADTPAPHSLPRTAPRCGPGIPLETVGPFAMLPCKCS
jgi:hypothetical protein